ncbi:MAG: hypothetical protein HY814_05915, partial [Candidatus Riflebacteria bacterium]|nr:hypothetical protein [Candidatus Riflebacteria bacterium]
MKKLLIACLILIVLVPVGLYVRRSTLQNAPALWYFRPDKEPLQKAIPLDQFAANLGSALGGTTNPYEFKAGKVPKQIITRALAVGIVPTVWLIDSAAALGLKPLYWLPPDKTDVLAVVVMAESPAQSLKDLQGKRGAMPARLSRFADLMFQAAGVDPKTAYQSLEPVQPGGAEGGPEGSGGGRQPPRQGEPGQAPMREVFQKLKTGGCDFLVIRAHLLDRNADQLNFLRIVHRGPPLPPAHAVVVATDAKPELVAAVDKALPPEITSSWKVKSAPGDFSKELLALGAQA